ncbi:5-carboxymethyl-2-hydroxymuconate isomerase [Xylaria sp. FL0933]|nr:5-carboxymethyl-2-hydroxymuconate isomerase [Xylaria sp. FL0933]
MGNWTHLIRFIAKEDQQVHLGQLVDVSRDVGKDSVDGVEIKAYLIRGSIFDGKIITGVVYTVERLLSPISLSECNYIRCLGLNYKDHAKEGGFALPEVPVLFTKPRTALADPYPAAVTIPKVAQDGTSDYEGELCVVIGRTGRDIPEEEALDYVLGYTASNDVSARKLQLLTAQWCFAKGLDGSCPLGPVLVAPSAIPDPQQLAIKTIYNGNVVQDGHTRDMIFSLRQQIAYLSQGTTLEAGSIILTGTPAGIGFFRKPAVVLEDGGDIRVEIEGIGTLVNRVRYDAD